MKWPAWIHAALRLGPKEVERVRPGLPTEDLRLLARTSEQPDDAVDLLVQRLRQPVPTRSRLPVWWLVVGTAVAAVFIATRLDPAPQSYGAIAIPLHQSASMSQLDTLDLGPSIRVDGLGDLTVEQADEHGTRVRLHRGSARFDIDPHGTHRALTVLAADTAVRVTGTQFIVHRLYDSVHVEVLRGSVEIEREGALSTVAAGGSWTHRGAVAAVSITPDVAVDSQAIASVERPAPEQQPDLPVPGVTPVAPPAEVPVEPVALTSGEAFAQILDALDGDQPPASVARALDAFLRQHPTSPMAPEATVLRLELAAELEPPRVVVADLEAWLRENLEHPRRLALLELQATLARDRLQDCELAMSPYRALAIEAPVALAARAEALRGLCALEIGARDEARTALANAVELGVDGALAADVTAAQALLEQP